MYMFIIVQRRDRKVVSFHRIAGMAMDKEAARSDVEKLQDLLESTTSKSKK